MSIVGSLDALEAATGATTAPRAAVFQPKVKPRARKGIAGGDAGRTVTAKLPAAPSEGELPSRTVRDPSPVSPAVSHDKIASDMSTRDSHLQNAPLENSVIKRSAGEKPFVQDGVDASTIDGRNGSSPQNDLRVAHAAPRNASTEDQSDFASLNESLVRDKQPPVAVRSSMPIPTTVSSAAAREDVELLKVDLPDSEAAGKAASKSAGAPGETICSYPKNRKNSSRIQGIATSSKNNKLGNGKRATEDPVSPGEVNREISTGLDGCEGEEAADVEDEPEVVPGSLTTGKRRRKHAFPHSTSRSRKTKDEDAEASPKIDFSKTDLSNPGKLTMREIIRRAEAIERKKVKADVTTKKPVQGGEKQKQPASAAAPAEVSMAPQVQVVDGKIVINEQSLTIAAYASSRRDTDTYTRVEESASRLNYNSYSNRTPVERWRSKDSDVFYKALEQFGTDFELIQNLFPGRTRRQVKAKFKKEERNNPRRLQEALAYRPKDQMHYADMITRLKADEPDPNAEDPVSEIQDIS